MLSALIQGNKMSKEQLRELLVANGFDRDAIKDMSKEQLELIAVWHGLLIVGEQDYEQS